MKLSGDCQSKEGVATFYLNIVRMVIFGKLECNLIQRSY